MLCVDEKSQIQALNRTQPVLPIGLGYVEGITSDFGQDGSLWVLANLNIQPQRTCSARMQTDHEKRNNLPFLRHLDESMPQELDLHLIVDNYATHKHPKVRTWFAQRPRYHMHYTPTYSSLAQPGGTLVRANSPTCQSPELVPPVSTTWSRKSTPS